MLEHTDHTGSVWRFLPSGHTASRLGKEQDTYIVRQIFFLALQAALGSQSWVFLCQ